MMAECIVSMIDNEYKLFTEIEEKITKSLNGCPRNPALLDKKKREVALLATIKERKRELKNARKVVKDILDGKSAMEFGEIAELSLELLLSDEKAQIGGG